MGLAFLLTFKMFPCLFSVDLVLSLICFEVITIYKRMLYLEVLSFSLQTQCLPMYCQKNKLSKRIIRGMILVLGLYLEVKLCENNVQ